MVDTVTELTPEQEDQEAAAALSAGYNKAAGQEDSPVAATADTETATTETAQASTEEETAPAVDPWQGVPAVVRQTLEGITTQLGGINALQNEVKAGTGRIAAIQRELAKAQSAGQPAPTKQVIAAAFESPEKLKKLAEEWPEIGEAVADALSRERTEILKQVPSVDVEGIKSDFGKTVAQATAEAVATARKLAPIDLKFPTWEEDVFAPDRSHTPAFAAWKNAQPPEMQALVSSERATDAIKMLDAFYAHRKAEALRVKNKEQLERSIPAKGTGGQRQPTTNERDEAERAFASA